MNSFSTLHALVEKQTMNEIHIERENLHLSDALNANGNRCSKGVTRFMQRWHFWPYLTDNQSVYSVSVHTRTIYKIFHLYYLLFALELEKHVGLLFLCFLYNSTPALAVSTSSQTIKTHHIHWQGLHVQSTNEKQKQRNERKTEPEKQKVASSSLTHAPSMGIALAKKRSPTVIDMRPSSFGAKWAKGAERMPPEPRPYVMIYKQEKDKQCPYRYRRNGLHAGKW